MLYFTQKLTYRVGVGVNRWRNVPQLELVAPARNRASSEPPPVWYSVAEIVAGPPSYQPRLPTLAPSKPSCNSVPPGGGGVVTVTVAVPLCPSLVAVIVADPTATPVTSPVPLTVATPVALLTHVTTRPVNALPLSP